MMWLYEWCFSDIFWLQFFIVYNFFLLLKSNNNYYSLLYLFIELVLLGIFVSFYQMELFSGFLWVAEGTVLLVFLILLIYTNSEGLERKNFFFFSQTYLYFLFVFIWCVFFTNNSIYEDQCYFLFEFVTVWDDYYEALSNLNMNDFSLLFISYYNINSFEFILFAFLLLLGTLVCVVMFKSYYSYRLAPLSSYLNVFDLYVNKLQYNFMRQQNLHKQGMATASSRIMRKK